MQPWFVSSRFSSFGRLTSTNLASHLILTTGEIPTLVQGNSSATAHEGRLAEAGRGRMCPRGERLGKRQWVVRAAQDVPTRCPRTTPALLCRLTPAMQREVAGPFLELLRAERSQLVKEAVGATCAIASQMGRDLTPFAVAIFKDLLTATGAGACAGAVCALRTGHFERVDTLAPTPGRQQDQHSARPLGGHDDRDLLVRSAPHLPPRRPPSPPWRGTAAQAC